MAVILTLLLIVTFIANYLTTSLPNTMGQNDLQHEVQVQNQVAQLSALLQAIAANEEVGAQVSQPVSLGSQGAPPFAVQDGSSLLPLANLNNKTGNYPQTNVSFSLQGVTAPVVLTGTAGFTVRMHNTYAPSAEVAYDQGAVVFVQPGSLPIFASPPAVTLVSKVLTLFVPLFANGVSGESGTGTAELNLRLLSVTSLTLPANGISFVSGSKINVTIVSPYVAAWYAFFQSNSAFAPYLVSCTGSNKVCTALYQTGGPLGTIKLSFPTSGLTLNLLTGFYSIAVN